MKRRNIKIFVSILLGAILIFYQLPLGQASQLDQKKAELDKVNRQIQERKKQLNDNQKQQKNIADELKRIDQDIDQTSRDLDRLSGELPALQSQIDKTEVQLQQKKKALEKQSEVLHQRLRDIYMEGNLSYLEVLLQSTSMSDFLTRFDFMKRIADQDSNLVNELAAERDKINRQQKDLMAKKQEIVVLQRTTTAKQNYLASRSQDRKAMQGELETDKAACERAIAEMEASSQQLTQIIQQHQSNNSSNPSNSAPPKRTGRFIWPAAGGVTSEYGMRWHPTRGGYRMHTGIDIGAGYGEPIRAADGGRVLFAGLKNGYGNTVVIDHGGGFSTLYAHMSRFAVSGGGVSQGQTIGYVGSTGYSTGPHLHFEVRVNGNHVNPMGYL